MSFGVTVAKMAKAWVYILRCADGSYYTGRTTDLAKRLAEHHSGEIKKWSRGKKEALIAGDWDMLRWLAKKPKFRK
jgi:predicted GIY-YIG superfamily endonuclease